MKLIFLSVMIALLSGNTMSQNAKSGKWEKLMACLKENNLEMKDFVKLAKKKPINPGNVNGDMKCALKCAFISYGYMDESSNFNEAVILKELGKYKEQNLPEAWGKCKSIRGSNACESALLLFKCMMENHLLKM